MEIVFLGHQGWFVSHGSTNLLIDPLLLPSFGHCPAVEFRVYPLRTVDLALMPPVDGVFLSHEHLDHLHLPSLDCISRTVPILMGELMPACVSEAVESLGFHVQRIQAGTVERLGDLELRLYPPGEDTVFWESRVYQILLTGADGGSPSVFVGVDATISTSFKAAVESGEISAPRAVICANNSQVPPPHSFNARSNLLPVRNPTHHGLAGLRILHSVLVSYLEGLPPIPDLVICGNGFVGGSSGVVPLFSDHLEMASLANKLSVDQRVFGPYPGERLRFEENETSKDRVRWIHVDEAGTEALKNTHPRQPPREPAADFAPLLGEFPSNEDAHVALELVQHELVSLARAIMVSPLGTLALITHQHLAGHVGPQRIALRLLGGPQGRAFHYALDITRAEFVAIETTPADLLHKFPFGLELYLVDFAGLLRGELQIWDLAGTAMRSWFMGGMYENWMSFLFGHYGEQVRPDLAALVYARSIDKLKAGRIE